MNITMETLPRELLDQASAEALVRGWYKVSASRTTPDGVTLAIVGWIPDGSSTRSPEPAANATASVVAPPRAARAARPPPSSGVLPPASARAGAAAAAAERQFGDGGPAPLLARAACSQPSSTAAEPTIDGGPQPMPTGNPAGRQAARNKAARNRKQRRIRGALIERQLEIQRLETLLDEFRRADAVSGPPPAAAAPSAPPPILASQHPRPQPPFPISSSSPGGFVSPAPPERMGVQSHISQQGAQDPGPSASAAVAQRNWEQLQRLTQGRWDEDEMDGEEDFGFLNGPFPPGVSGVEY